jgi:hypothetical protein
MENMMDDMVEKMMNEKMEMVDGMMGGKNEATNLASCLVTTILPSGYDIHSLPWKDPPIFEFGKPSMGHFPWLC